MYTRGNDYQSPSWRLPNTANVQPILGELGELKLSNFNSHIYHRHEHDIRIKLEILAPKSWIAGGHFGLQYYSADNT